MTGLVQLARRRIDGLVAVTALRAQRDADPEQALNLAGVLAESEVEALEEGFRLHAALAEHPIARRLVRTLDVDSHSLEVLLVAAAFPEHLSRSRLGDLLGGPIGGGRLAIDACLARRAPLRAWGLLEGEDDILHCPPRVRDVLDGRDPEGDLPVLLRRLPLRSDPRIGDPAFAAAATRLGRASRSVVALIGPPGSGRRRLAAALAHRVQKGAMEIAVDLLDGPAEEQAGGLRRALRECALADAVPVLEGLDRLARVDRERVLLVAGRVLDAVGWAAPLVVVAIERCSLRPLADDVVWIAAVPAPGPARAAFFRQRLDDALGGGLPADAALEAERLAQLYPLSPGALEAAARDAAEAARGSRLGASELTCALRSKLDHQLASVAEPVRHRVELADLVVDPDIRERLEEFLVYVRHQPQVYDRWGFGRRMPSRGFAALFSGPPGTGKTMAASVLATELGRELFRVDISRVVSKYVGETEANLSRVFAEATSSRAILLFDEADSLFGKRADVKGASDRYANMEVNYLLQKMEEFDGISILTTNLESAVDRAFLRRLQFRLRFTAPDEAQRAALWRKVIPEQAPLADGVDWDELGRLFELTGGFIRNAALRAAYLAAARATSITHDLLLEAGERELAETGRIATSKRVAQASTGAAA